MTGGWFMKFCQPQKKHIKPYDLINCFMMVDTCISHKHHKDLVGWWSPWSDWASHPRFVCSGIKRHGVKPVWAACQAGFPLKCWAYTIWIGSDDAKIGHLGVPHFQRDTCFKIQLRGGLKMLEGSFSHLDPTAYFQPLHRGPPEVPRRSLRDSSALRARNRGFAPLVFGDLRFRRGEFRQDTPLSIAWVMACEWIASHER